MEHDQHHGEQPAEIPMIRIAQKVGLPNNNNLEMEVIILILRINREQHNSEQMWKSQITHNSNVYSKRGILDNEKKHHYTNLRDPQSCYR
jgi:hypothetical protein